MEALDRPAQYSFGVEGMKRLKVCPRCSSMVSASRYVCPECGARLPQGSLFQLYRQSHRSCPICDTVLADSMRFCPHCGTKIEPRILNEPAGLRKPDGSEPGTHQSEWGKRIE